MPGFPTPRSLLILDRRPEYARLLAALATSERPGLLVATLHDLDEAQRWLAETPAPVLILADVTAADGRALALAQAWRRERPGVTLVATFDANAEDEVLSAAVAGATGADAALPKPCCRSAWRRSFGALLGSGAPAGAAV